MTPQMLRAAMISAGLGRADFAREAGVGDATLGRFLAGGVPRAGTLAAMTDALSRHGVTIEIQPAGWSITVRKAAARLDRPGAGSDAQTR